jgi:beta-galactosidase/beta-glucuronidase
MASSTPPLDYPRPDFVRSALRWESLNGPWDFLFDDADAGQHQGWHHQGLPTHAASTEGKPASKRTIQVPFVFQALASGIHERGVHQVLWYERRIDDLRSAEEKAEGYHLLLRFGAVDYHAKVWLNGQYIGEHRGGHVPFDLDLTDAFALTPAASSRLTIRVFDSAYDLTQPRGKQYWAPEPESIFYTPSSGIWQSVWLESVPPARIVDGSYGTIIKSTNIERGILDARVSTSGRRVGQALSIEVESSLGGVVIGTTRQELPRDEDFVRIFEVNMRLSPEHFERLPPEFTANTPPTDRHCWRDGVALWSPECPFLYDVALRLFDGSGKMLDEVRTTTGMRSLDWTTGDGTFRMNGKPLFQALLLDQGYWPETLMTPPSSEALKRDIELSKAMGFNGCRKHQKVEDPVFMYWADRLGFLVWGEMASCYHFSMEMVKRFDQEWMEMIRRDINHPSIITWTPVNESWGYNDLGGDKRQRDHIRSLYYTTKTYDPTRPINDNCGWEHVVTDISSFHEYADAQGMTDRCASLKEIVARGRPMFLGPIYEPRGSGVADPGSRHLPGAPVMCTEFGGVNVAAANDESRKGNWGYTTARDARDLLQRIDGQVVATLREGLISGIVWTQFTDIEQEQNGLYSYDRREKLPAGEVRGVLERAKAMYFAKLAQ